MLFLLANTAYSQTVKSNHSYKNLGFTQTPTVSIGGHINVMGASTKQEKAYSEDKLVNVLSDTDGSGVDGITTLTLNNRATDDPVGAVDASLTFNMNGINDYGFKYGAFIELNANTTKNSWNNNLNSRQAYIYGEGLLGKFEIGNTLGASQKMKIDASTFARAAGGINGEYLNFINLPSISKTGVFASTPLFILIPELPTAHGGYAVGFNNLYYACDSDGDGIIDELDEIACYEGMANDNYRLNFEQMQNATKVSFYTPELWGLQFGVSYTPDTGNIGTSGYLTSKLDTGDIDDVIEYGVSFTQTMYGIGVSASFTGERGKSESKIGDSSTPPKYISFREDLNAYQYGVNLTFWGLTIGGSIGNWENSLYYKNSIKNASNEEGTYSTYGAAYEFGPVNVSFGCFNSEFQENEYMAYSVGIDFKVAKGFLPYIEYTNFKFTPFDTNIEVNKGHVILAGFLFNF